MLPKQRIIYFSDIFVFILKKITSRHATKLSRTNNAMLLVPNNKLLPVFKKNLLLFTPQIV